MMTYREIQREEEGMFDAFVKQHPSGSLWQSAVWKNYEERCGRTIRRFAGWQDGAMYMAAQVSIDRTVGNIATWTVQRGPLWDASTHGDDVTAFVKFLSTEAKQDRAMSLFLSPPHWNPVMDLPGRSSDRHVMPEATMMIDLSQSEEEMLKAMHPKGRYNINIAKRDGVTMETSGNLDAFYELLQKTGARDGFGVKKKAEYEAFLKMPGSFLLVARAARHELRETSENERSKLEARSSKIPIAGLLGIVWSTQAIYYYGASDHAYRALMGPYLLQWATIQRAKASGCISYDLLGIAPPSAPSDDPWQGITDFKKKFGGTIIEYPSEREIIVRPFVRAIIRGKRKILG